MHAFWVRRTLWISSNWPRFNLLMIQAHGFGSGSWIELSFVKSTHHCLPYEKNPHFGSWASHRMVSKTFSFNHTCHFRCAWTCCSMTKRTITKPLMPALVTNPTAKCSTSSEFGMMKQNI